jgi:hypothetical protein
LVLVEETLSWLVFIICFLSFPEPSPAEPLFLSKGRGGGEGYILPLFYFVYPAWPAEPGPPLRGGGERINSAGPAEPLFLSKGARVNNIVTLYLLIVYLFYFYDKKQKVNTYSYFSCRSVNKK